MGAPATKQLFAIWFILVIIMYVSLLSGSVELVTCSEDSTYTYFNRKTQQLLMRRTVLNTKGRLKLDSILKLFLLWEKCIS